MSGPIIIATRGSALALTQSNTMKAACEKTMPGRAFELRIIKTTGDKLQTASMTKLPADQSTKGLFTKELEVALLNGEADLAVHSLKDLPTELPEGLILGATPPREDVRDVLIVRANSSATANEPLKTLERGITIATSSTRRAAQIQALRPDIKITPIRGNVGTRIKKLLAQPELGGTILAAAGLNRLNFTIAPDGTLSGNDVPAGAKAFRIPLQEMLPCVGQAAIGIEIRATDLPMQDLCAKLNDPTTFACVTAERAFLRAMGGGCLSPVAAYAIIKNDALHIRAVALKSAGLSRVEISGPVAEAEKLGAALALKI
ncbi:MAG TPA: hydroxymethylbilane synthase [Verrucomicrobiae bacterium]|nr:hydroxymethylbilane synthase [Verrucomicrobiae bacterium]